MKEELKDLSLSQAINWLNTFNNAVCLHSNGFNDEYSRFDFLLGAGEDAVLTTDENSLDQLKEFYEQHKNWCFGFLSYNLKDELEDLKSNHLKAIGLPHVYFFIPKYIIGIKNGDIEFIKGDESILSDIQKTFVEKSKAQENLEIIPKMTKSEYLDQIKRIKEHIKRGDIYEVTYSQEFYSNSADINPIDTFLKLCSYSPAPFTSFLKLNDRYIISASPERYLAKRGTKIISQPIKGTAKRSSIVEQDLKIKEALQNDPKELAENVMIVDLVRNDLARFAKPGSVKVQELFGVYTFPHVHQLISTITCELSTNNYFLDAIKYSFPMGSMTGAPKIKAMEIIESYEMSSRDGFSGSIGWIDPNGDFDFNVLIRSIFYNKELNYLSIQTGGAITDLSDPEIEYQETILKATALFNILGKS